MPQRTARAFTLIELLVCVAIIALLLALMMPSLSNARRVSRTAVCASNLHGLSLAMNVYAAEWNNAILGNAYTSSAHLFRRDYTAFAPGISDPTNVPGVIQTNDWMSPTARVMGITFNEKGTPADRSARFMQFNSFKAFTCPEIGELVSTTYTGDGGPNFPVHRPISYNTSFSLQIVAGPPGTASNGYNNQIKIPSSFGVHLNGYYPKVSNVGNPGTKIYMADSARWYNGSGALSLDDNAAIQTTSPGGLTSEWGPWNANTRAFNLSSTGDGRTASMRHGPRVRGAKYATFKFNAAFFDGHVETMDGLTGANPSLWVPSGATVDTSECISNVEFRGKYCPAGRAPRIE